MLGFKLLISLVICQITAVLGSAITRHGMANWYNEINKPFFTPPSWIFVSVWSFVFVMAGIALFIVLIQNEKYKEVVSATIFFIAQLLVNTLFSVVFFVFHWILGGIFVQAFLLILLIITTIKFFKIYDLAGFLMVPYVLWIIFAIILNTAIFLLNI